MIEWDRLSAGGRSERVDGGAADDLIRHYLRLIRRARKVSRHRSIAVRREDIVLLAEHLGWSPERVLGELARHVGATRPQRAAMLAVLATGASLITISAPAAAGSGASIAAADARPAVHAPAQASGRKSQPHGASQLGAANLGPGLGERPPADPPAVPPATSVGPPATVAVGTPPVPPVIGDDGNAVAVGQPPVPPAADDDGNAVAVGQPPVPPGPGPAGTTPSE